MTQSRDILNCVQNIVSRDRGRGNRQIPWDPHLHKMLWKIRCAAEIVVADTGGRNVVQVTAGIWATLMPEYDWCTPENLGRVSRKIMDAADASWDRNAAVLEVQTLV